MESPEKTKNFLNDIFYLFSPVSVRLKVNRTHSIDNEVTENAYYYRFNNLDSAEGKISLITTLSTRPFMTGIEEVEIIATAGTIRKHSDSYDRKPYTTVDFMDMKIDLLPVPEKATKPQRVRLSPGKLSRDGTFIQELPLENLKEEWNENPDSQINKMPNPLAPYLLAKPKRNHLRHCKTRSSKSYI